MLNMTKLGGRALLAATFAVGFAAAATAQTKIGIIQPLTGPAAASGNYVANGAKIAAEEINAKGGVLGQKSSSSSRTTRQPDRSRRGRREADHARQGAGADGRMGIELHARGDAQAHGVQGPDAGRDLLLGQDHDLRQSLYLPHLAALCDGGRGVRANGSGTRHKEGRLPRGQQRLGPRRGGRFQQDAESEGHPGRARRDYGPGRPGHQRAAQQDQELRRRHLDHHDCGRAADPRLQAGRGART